MLSFTVHLATYATILYSNSICIAQSLYQVYTTQKIVLYCVWYLYHSRTANGFMWQIIFIWLSKQANKQDVLVVRTVVAKIGRLIALWNLVHFWLNLLDIKCFVSPHLSHWLNFSHKLTVKLKTMGTWDSGVVTSGLIKWVGQLWPNELLFFFLGGGGG